MTDKKKNGWIRFVPSLDLPKERVSIAYDTHDERGVRYAYGYFQFYNGTCGCFWKDGNEQPKVVKAEDIKYWMPVPSLDVQEEPVSEEIWEASKQYALRQVLASTDTEMSEQAYLDLRLFSGFELAVAHKDGAKWKEEQFEKDYTNLCNGVATAKGLAVAMAYDKGKADEREQMMKDAYDAYVSYIRDNSEAVVHLKNTSITMSCHFPKRDLEEGDKVKIVIIKEKQI